LSGSFSVDGITICVLSQDKNTTIIYLLCNYFHYSFTYKNLFMLTRKSIVTATLSLSMLLPATTFAQQPKRVGNIAKSNGNTIEFEPQKKMTTDTMTDAEGKQHIMRHDWANIPIKLNGEKIYTSRGEMAVTKPRIKAKEISLADYLVKQLTPMLEQQADGEYNLIISNVIINAQGKVVYYENTGVQKIGADIDEKSTNKKTDQ